MAMYRRPLGTDYKFLGVMKSLFSGVPIMGLTATATTRVAADVKKILNLDNVLVFKASFNRPNLFYEVSCGLEFPLEVERHFQNQDLLSNLVSNVVCRF